MQPMDAGSRDANRGMASGTVVETQKDDAMQTIERFPRKLLSTLFVMFFLLFFIINAAIYLQLPAWIQEIAQTVKNQLPSGDPAVAEMQLAEIRDQAAIVAVAFTALIMVLVGILLWSWQRRAFNRVVLKPLSEKMPVDAAPEKKEPPERSRNEKMYLHLLSMFQKEGRLIDFLSENLDSYTDGQIGAAARQVHAGCKQVLAKTVDPEAVISAEEGSPYVVEDGFDPAEIKLTGNVAGQPPFSGVIRHCGWRARKVRMPILSDSSGKRILAQAEIEI